MDIKITLSSNPKLRSPNIESEAAWIKSHGPVYYGLPTRPMSANPNSWVYFIRDGRVAARARIKKVVSKAKMPKLRTYAGGSANRAPWNVRVSAMEIAAKSIPHRGFQGFRYVSSDDQVRLAEAFPSRARGQAAHAKTNSEVPTGSLVWTNSTAHNLFFREVGAHRDSHDFDESERDYKIQLASQLEAARDALGRRDRNWRQELSSALRSRNNNIINWRHTDRLLKVLADRPTVFRGALIKLWFGRDSVEARINAFATILTDGPLAQSGSQLTIGSTLLMALNPRTHPPVRTRRFNEILARLGLPTLASKKSPGVRYGYSMWLLDNLIRGARKQRIDLRDRLDAQSVVWCMDGTWDPSVKEKQWNDDDVIQKKLKAIRAAKNLTTTEKRALILSRRGQGLFRERLLEIWGRCAITGCHESKLLRASHLKPWKISNNSERLDGFNGLMLVPNLDCALDRGLISFDRNGKIMISTTLKPEDCKALGITRGMTLRRVVPEQRKFLQYHRRNVFLDD